jgi:hypothetical protein
MAHVHHRLSTLGKRSFSALVEIRLEDLEPEPRRDVTRSRLSPHEERRAPSAGYVPAAPSAAFDLTAARAWSRARPPDPSRCNTAIGSGGWPSGLAAATSSMVQCVAQVEDQCPVHGPLSRRPVDGADIVHQSAEALAEVSDRALVGVGNGPSRVADQQRPVLSEHRMPPGAARRVVAEGVRHAAGLGDAVLIRRSCARRRRGRWAARLPSSTTQSSRSCGTRLPRGGCPAGRRTTTRFSSRLTSTAASTGTRQGHRPQLRRGPWASACLRPMESRSSPVGRGCLRMRPFSVHLLS